jgi:L-ascorbate metabolism protein UlaG (beta-lactamase superfamily)
MGRITWLGHSTVLIETGGARLLTDPVLRDRVMHLRRRAPPPADPGRLDGVLVSHVHHDHLDRPSLRRLAAPGVAAVLPVGAARLLSGMPFAAVHEVRAGDALEVGGARVEPVPAWHDGRRLPGPRAREHATLGFLVDDVWFAGDTDYNDEMEALRGRVGLALLPIWGWGPSIGPGHLDPREAARVVALVEPRVVVPIHWGTFLPIGAGKRHQHVLTQPAERFAMHAAELAPSARIETLDPGGTLDF